MFRRNRWGESFRTFLVGEFIGRYRGELETRRENCEHRLLRPRSDQWVRAGSILLLVLELVNDHTRNSLGHSCLLVVLCLFNFLPSFLLLYIGVLIYCIPFSFCIMSAFHVKQKRRKSGFTRDIRKFGWDEKERSRLYDGR